MSQVIELSLGRARVRIAPGLGGAIMSYTWAAHPVLRPTPEAALEAGNVRLAACYPLVPYSNRIRDARLRFAGRNHPLARNFGDHPHSIHGVGWQRAWSIVEATRSTARLELAHARSDAGAWPWAFRATETFELVADGASPCALLGVTLTLENVDRAPFPFGLGWHPFLPRDARTLIQFGADGVWQNDVTELPMRHVEVPSRWRFDRPRTLDGATLDNVFTGWDGSVAVIDRTTGIRTTITADRACRFLVVYAPRDAAFIALEPVTHETDAFNRAADGAMSTGLRTLPPGAAFSCTMRIAAAAID